MPTILIDTSTNDLTLVAAPPTGQFIRVKGFNITANGTVTVSLKSNSTAIWKTYAMADTTKGGIINPISEIQDMDCTQGQALKLGLSSAVAVAGSLTYEIYGVPPT